GVVKAAVAERSPPRRSFMHAERACGVTVEISRARRLGNTAADKRLAVVFHRSSPTSAQRVDTGCAGALLLLPPHRHHPDRTGRLAPRASAPPRIPLRVKCGPWQRTREERSGGYDPSLHTVATAASSTTPYHLAQEWRQT